ncbi:MAG: DUF503 family protein [Phycisphaerales bacterium]
MVVGVLQFELHVQGAESLKDKRRVVRSVRDRLHREHMVSVAEVGALDTLNLAVMGLAVVGNDGKRVADVLDKVSAKLRSLHDAELGATSRQIIVGEDSPGAIVDEMDAEALAREMLARAEGAA